LNELQPGSVVANSYRIVRKVASGGMASVFEANERARNRRVALKIPHEAYGQDRKMMRRFLREARATLSIRSPFVVRTLAVGKLGDGLPFLIMEYVEGTPLRDLMYDEAGEPRPMPLQQALLLLDQIACGLAAAHDVRVVHRDMKPDNVLVTTRNGAPVAKIFDFGLSLLTGELTGSRLTEPNTTLGTPQYMPPEQAQSARHADVRSDIYSLGVIAYEMLSAHLPFPGETLQEVWSSSFRGNAIPLASWRPELPQSLTEAIMTAISRVPARRHASVHAFRACLIAHFPDGALPSLHPPPAPAPAARLALARLSLRQLPFPVLLAAVFVTVLALGAAAIMLVRVVMMAP
jgi:serine/threonine-protein kinase